MQVHQKFRRIPEIWLLAFSVCLPSAAQQKAPLESGAEISLSGLRPGFWAKYVLSSGQHSVREGWITFAAGAASQVVKATPGTHFRVIAYAPGCALQTLDTAIVEAKPYRLEFQCMALRQITLSAAVTPIGRRYDHAVAIEAKYVVSWARDFLHYDDGTTTEVPLGGPAEIDSHNRFTLQIPDLSADNLVNSSDPALEIRLWVRDQTTHQIVDQLKPCASQTGMRLGGISLKVLHSEKQVYKFSPVNDPTAHDEYGFNLRPGPGDDCAQ